MVYRSTDSLNRNISTEIEILDSQDAHAIFENHREFLTNLEEGEWYHGVISHSRRFLL